MCSSSYMDSKKAEQLRKAHKEQKDIHIEYRIHAVILTRVHGWDVSKTAECLLPDPKWVCQWMDRYDKEYLDGLSIRPRSGRSPKADPRHVNKITSEMCDTGSTPAAIQNAIKNKLGIHTATLIQES